MINITGLFYKLKKVPFFRGLLLINMTFLTFVFIDFSAVQAQQLTVNASAAISIPANVFFGTGGNVTIQTSGVIENNGTFGVKGNFINNGGTLNSGTGNIIFSGTVSSQLLQSNGSTLYDLTISKTAGVVTLADDATITHQLTLSQGNIETGTNNIVFTSSAADPVELNTSRIVGNSVMQSRSVGTGTLSFLGADIAAGSDNIGTVSLNRVSGPGGICSNGTNSGIACYWIITPASQPASGRDVAFHWLSDLDNGKNFSTDQAAVWENNGSLWLPVGSAAMATNLASLWTSPTVTTTLFTKWTISTGSSPLPVELLSFNANCDDGKVNLNWVTASETNNDYFTVERSKDESIFENVLNHSGAGSSNHIISYSAIDNSPYTGNSYYRLKQTDFDGTFTYSTVVPVSCGKEQEFGLISVIPGTQDHEIILTFVADGDEQYTYSVYDITGKLMKKSTGIAASGINEVHINTGFLAESLYMVNLQSNEKSFSRKVVLK